MKYLVENTSRSAADENALLKHWSNVIWLLLVVGLGSACEQASFAELIGGQPPAFSFDTISLTYPRSLREEVALDDYFGYPVADPYRWLESDTATRVQDWTAAQQATTEQYLAEVPFRAAIAEWLSQLNAHPRTGLPSFHGGYYYYRYHNGKWGEDILVRSVGLKDSMTTVLNPNTWSAGTGYRLGRYAFSVDGRYLAYEQQAKDGGRSTIRIVDLVDRTSLANNLEVQGLTTLAWYEEGFFYTSFPAGPLDKPQLFHRLYYHRLGTAQAADELIFTDHHDPTRRITAYADTASQCLVLEVKGNGMGNAVYFRPLQSEDPSFTPITASLDYRFEWAGGTAGHLYFITDFQADQGRLLKISTDQPGRGYWEEHVAEETDEMLASWRVGSHWLVTYLRDAAHHVQLYDSLGQQVRRIHLPGPSSFTGLTTGKNAQEMFFGVSSFFHPENVYRLDLNRYRSALVYSHEPVFAPADYQLTLRWLNGYDDASLPLLILHQKTLNLTEPHPTLLIAADAAGEPLVPHWNPTGHGLVPAALEQGMIIAIANLRGSAGFGRAWKQAGLVLQQQTRLDDLQAVAEYLREQPFVAPNKLAVYGAGQGATLVAATLNQRPDLFAVALVEGGWYDLLRYHQFRASVDQLTVFGTSEDSLQTDHLLSYSPLQNVVPSKFPATLLLANPQTTAGVPLHSRKLAAELQYQQRGHQPTLLYPKSAGATSNSEGVAALSFLFYQTQTRWE